MPTLKEVVEARIADARATADTLERRLAALPPEVHALTAEAMHKLEEFFGLAAETGEQTPKA